MKKKVFNKLTINKTTVSNLNKVQGGGRGTGGGSQFGTCNRCQTNEGYSGCQGNCGSSVVENTCVGC